MSAGYHAALRAAIHAGANADDAVRTVVEGLSRDELIEIARPAILMAARTIERAETRSRETSVRVAIAQGVSRPEALLRLNRERFALPSGTFVPWATATIAQHSQRSAWLRSQAKGLRETADLHDIAVREIRKAGVTCLAELDTPEARKLLAEIEGRAA